ncbi:MAG TPA: sulfur transferase domain-containing protein [Pseudomonadales bacterium]
MNHKILLAVVLLLSAGGSTTGSAEAGGDAFSAQIKAVDERTVIAGLVDLNALRAAHPEKVLVVDLRTAAEGAEAEGDAAAALGMDYVNSPVASASVDPVQVDALRTTLAGADPEALIVVHCATGNRASMLWGAMRLADGSPMSEVRGNLDGILTKQPAIDGLDAFARTLNAGQ